MLPPDVLSGGPASLVYGVCLPSLKVSTIFAQNAGRSSGLRLVTNSLSTTTSSSTQFGRHLVAGRKFAGCDHTLKAVKKLIRKFTTNDGFDWLGHRISLMISFFLLLPPKAPRGKW